MRSLQTLCGLLAGVALIWAGTHFLFGRSVYARLPAVLSDLPWSSDAKHPAHVPTSLLTKTCGGTLATNDDLVGCLRRQGLTTGTAPDGTATASFEAGVGFSPTIHHMAWRTETGELPRQIDTWKS